MELKEETLDPDDWDEMRALGHRMLDDMMTRLELIREHKFDWDSWEESRRQIRVPLTDEGEGVEKTYELFRDYLMNQETIVTKPIFWGAVAGTGSPYGMLTMMLTGGVNLASNSDPSLANATHRQVIDWIKKMLDYPEEAGGVLVSGGSEANFTGIAVARNTMAKKDMKTEGVYGQPEKMVLYCSDETHECVDRSIELLGLGGDALRWLPTDDNCVLKIPSLKKAIKDDRAKGLYPFCIIGNAGTVNSGAFDDFKELKKIASKEKLWLHVDGAFGAWIKLSDTYRRLADGIELADSLAVDLHKWMNMPYGLGCTLVRDALAHYKTFVYGHEAAYINSLLNYSDDVKSKTAGSSLQLSRNNVSLRAYMLLRAYGRNKYARLVQQNIDQINYLAEQIEMAPNLELTAPVISNIACFRYNPGGLTEEQLAKLNKAIVWELWTKINFFIISDTTIKGRYMLRACNVNNRSRRKDFDFLVSEVKRIGGVLSEV